MASTSTMRATASCRKRVSTPTREFVRSGACKSLSFKELPRCSAEQSKMMRLGWVENSMMGKVTSSSLNTERSLHIPSEGGLLCRLRTLLANLNPSTDASQQSEPVFGNRASIVLKTGCVVLPRQGDCVVAVLQSSSILHYF